MEIISLPTKAHVDRGNIVNGEWVSSTSGGALGYDFTPDAINVCFYGFYIETVLVYPFEHDAEEIFVYPCNLTVKDIFGNVSTKQITPFSWTVLEIGNVACMSIQMGDGRETSKAECYDENGNEIELIWGLAVDPELTDEVKITVLATGFGMENIPFLDENPENDVIDAIYGRDICWFELKDDDLDNDELLDMISSIPTYQRDTNGLQQIRACRR